MNGSHSSKGWTGVRPEPSAASSRPPKRILMTADTVGGVWTYAIELCHEFGKRGIEVGLATMGAPLNRAQRHEVGHCPSVEVFESAYKLEWMSEPWNDVERAGDWLLELEDKIRPDIVHLNNFSHGALPCRAPKVVVGHSCVLSWWRAVHGCDAPGEWKIYQDMVTEGTQLADLVAAPSLAMLNALNAHYGPFGATAVIPNGRRIETNAPHAKHDFILAAGRLWDEAKNISALRKIAPELPWPVYVAGNAENQDGTSKELAGVHHLGKLPATELLHWFERAAIYTLPARYEPFGLSVLEAALCGCALVLGDIPSLRENWDGAALFVSPDDPEALKEALNHLIDDPRLRQELAQIARQRSSQFTPDKMAEAYLAVYNEASRRKSATKVQEVACAS